MSEEVTLPVEAIIPLPPKDAAEEAAMQAAFFYQQAKDERARIMGDLARATKALEEKNYQIGQLQSALNEERKEHAFTKQAYENAIRDCADLEAVLAVEQDFHEDRAARLAKFEFSRLKRRRNGKHKPSDTLPDTIRSEGEMAVASAVLSDDQPQQAT
jgi:hypothetical protein